MGKCSSVMVEPRAWLPQAAMAVFQANPAGDCQEGWVRFERGPDNTVYFQVVLRDYLKARPEASLLEADPSVEKIKRLPTMLQ